MDGNFMDLLLQFEKDKGISRDVLIEALEDALAHAYKRNYSYTHSVRVAINQTTGEMTIYQLKTVTDQPSGSGEISLDEARALNPIYNVGDTAEIEVAPGTFGRIAAQTARQVVMQRIREAERGNLYNEFANKQGTIVTGIIRRVERRNVLIDIGATETILPPQEQPPNEKYLPGNYIKVYIVEVAKTPKGPQIVISRTHPGLVKRLFELEVPEIKSGVVEIKSVSREAGSRTKIAVYSHNSNVDPIGTCVGAKGLRVQNIVDEINGEKIDIVAYSDDPETFIKSALSPAKVIGTRIDIANKLCTCVVAPDQLSLAIGKEGQNVRLSARLTGYKIDIKKNDDYRDEEYA